MESKPLTRLVALIVLGVFVFVVASFLFIPLQNKDVAHFLIGEITGMTSGIVMYHFGSSLGSKAKQATIDKKLNEFEDGFNTDK